MKEKQSEKAENTITRRKLLQILGCGAISAVLTTACRFNSIEQKPGDVMTANNPQIHDKKASELGRLLSRPSKSTKEAAKTGLVSLQLDKNRETLLYVPKGYNPENLAPFALMLHGAGGNAQHGISLLQHLADEAGIILLATKSRTATWDVIADDYGVDVEFIDRALAHIFEHYAIDNQRLAVGGFSDGASYALSLGVINGELFSHVLAFSPGFMAPTGQSGNPRFYISHGTQDRVLPIDRCSRKLVPQLKSAGYEVIYREFEGPHTIPPSIAREGVEWLTAKT
jgi:phospholipase/carboxylesterase